MTDITPSQPVPNLEEIWQLFKETDYLFKQQAQEAERRAQEADRRNQEADRRNQEAERRAQEADRRFQETERFLKEQAKKQAEDAKRRAEEAERRFQETERLIKESGREVDKRLGELGNRLGQFVEGLVKPAVVRLFQERGIPVCKTYGDVTANNPELNLATQIDLFAINGDSCVLVEVKSHLSVDDVNEHLERMDKFKPLFPEYADKIAYGAVAGMVLPDDVAKYAYRKGFFVIGQRGDIAKILNDEKFKPKGW